MNTKPPSPAERPKRGSALIIVVFTLFLVMLVVSAVYMLARQNLLNVGDDYYKDKANFGSRAGIEHAIAQLTLDPQFGSATAYPGVGQTIPETALENEPDVTYTVQILNNDVQATPPNPRPTITAPDGLEIPPDIVWVKSTGSLRDRSDSSSTSIVKLVGYQRPILKQAAFGSDKVTVSNNSTIQGWDSTNLPLPVVVPKRGDIGTNSTLTDAIVVNSGGSVDGQARAGVGTLSTNLASVVNRSPLTAITDVVISEESTQIPRFIINSADANSYKFRLTKGLGNLTPPIPGEEAAKYYYHRVLKASPNPAGQVSVSYAALGGDNDALGEPDDPTFFDMPSGTPEEQAATKQIFQRPYLGPGSYDLSPATDPPSTPGTLTLKNVVLRRTQYFFKGDLVLDGTINVDPATSATGFPCVIYVDGNVTIKPGARINWDGYNNEDFNNNGVKDEPLSPRLLQIYTVLDKDEMFDAATQTITVGATGGARTKASFVGCGANMIAKIHESDYYGGLQGFDISVLDNSHAFFDVDLYGKPLEGRGELAVLVSTVSVYMATTIAAAGPPPAPVAMPGPGPSAPTYTSTGWCTNLLPLPPKELECALY